MSEKRLDSFLWRLANRTDSAKRVARLIAVVFVVGFFVGAVLF